MKNILLITFVSIGSLFHCLAQDTLKVTCQQDEQNALLNRIQINSNMVEYGICTYYPCFYVSVIDPDCQVWGTKYGNSNPDHDFGNLNNDGGCRNRIEKYFIYNQSDSLDLENLDSLLNFWIPDNHVIAIWTPLSFSFSSVNAINPNLSTTLWNKWGSAVQTDSILVLFGVQGSPQSFDLTTNQNNGQVVLEKIVCQDSNIGLEELSNSTAKTVVKILDLTGREVPFRPNQVLIYVYSDGTMEKRIVLN